jgi:CheY-like chemotaxis protein
VNTVCPLEKLSACRVSAIRQGSNRATYGARSCQFEWFGHSSARLSLSDRMKQHIRLDGLLVSDDPQVLSVMNGVLTNFAIEAEVCSEFISAIDAVTKRRFDTVIVDWKCADNPIRVVNGARKSTPNSNATIVAMVDERSEMQAALLAGANFIIHKPTSRNDARRCMRAAYGTMLNQRRRAARCPVDIPVIAKVAELGRLEATITDISVGGLALQCSQPLQLNWTVSLEFLLPVANDRVHIVGKVVNADGSGRAGVCLSFVPEEEFSLLVTWLATELAKLENAEIPASGYLEN